MISKLANQNLKAIRVYVIVTEIFRFFLFLSSVCAHLCFRRQPRVAVCWFWWDWELRKSRSPLWMPPCERLTFEEFSDTATGKGEREGENGRERKRERGEGEGERIREREREGKKVEGGREEGKEKERERLPSVVTLWKK